MKAVRMFSSIDTHTGGEPTRTITGGLPYIPGKTVAEKMIHLKENSDWIRTALMYEPRGHSVMSGVFLTEPTRPDADIGAIFIETSGYLPMCGHDTIGVCTAMVETGMVDVHEPETFIRLDTPAGLTTARVRVENGSAKSVTFKNVPSFAFLLDQNVDVEGFENKIRVDVAWGGNVYALVSAPDLGIEILPSNASRLVEMGRRIRKAVNSQLKIQHPELPFVNQCTHVEFYGPATAPGALVKNAVFLGESGIDRSPCGTGTCAKAAVLVAKGQLAVGEEFVHESIIGSLFRARPVEETQVGGYSAVAVEITGSAHLMGTSQFFIDPDDPLGHGFLLE